MPLLESDIQRQILDYLSLKGIFHYRNNTSGIYIQKTGKYRPSHSKGAPDIVGIVPDGSGRFLGIEIKKPGGKLSPDQIVFLDNIWKAGGIPIVAYSLEDVIRALEPPKRRTMQPGKRYNLAA